MTFSPAADLPVGGAYAKARDALPANLQPEYDSLVVWYRYLATLHNGQPFVSYKILADLIRSGWRLSAKPLDAPTQ